MILFRAVLVVGGFTFFAKFYIENIADEISKKKKGRENHEDQKYQRNVPNYVQVWLMAETLGEVQRSVGPDLLSC